MKTTRILSAVVIALLITGSRPAAAEGWSLAKLNPFCKKDSGTADRRKPAKPSPLKKLGNDTKAFFAKTRDVLSWKKPAREPTTAERFPWQRRRDDQRAAQSPKKPSWFGSMFRPAEPKVPESTDEWMSLQRMDP